MRLNCPERLLIVAPHQDDCVLIAGGLGIRNQKLGGKTQVVYLTQPNAPGIAATRRAEVIAAWSLAGVPEGQLHHWSVLPAKGLVTDTDVARLARDLQELVTSFRPTIIVVPAFEGGHFHHDVAHHVVTRLLRLPADATIYEGPEYSPYFSLWRTPELALAYLARYCFAGFVSYYPKAEGVGHGPILNLSLSLAELELKRRMLFAFRSQNGDSLARNHGYADRLILWRDRAFGSAPFEYVGSKPWFITQLQSMLPPRLVHALIPGEARTIGLEQGITDLSKYAVRSDASSSGVNGTDRLQRT